MIGLQMTAAFAQRLRRATDHRIDMNIEHRIGEAMSVQMVEGIGEEGSVQRAEVRGEKDLGT